MNKEDHFRFGALLGALRAGASAIKRADNGPITFGGFLAEVAGGALGGAFGAAAPDALEPAIHPHHRKVAHSMTVGVGVAVLGETKGAEVAEQLTGAVEDIDRRVAAKEHVTDEERAKGALSHFAAGAVRGASAGYVSHLALDALTPRGIPILGLT